MGKMTKIIKYVGKKLGGKIQNKSSLCAQEEILRDLQFYVKIPKIHVCLAHSSYKKSINYKLMQKQTNLILNSKTFFLLLAKMN